MNLDNFFQPKSIALIGASRDTTSLGFNLLNNLLKYGYAGKLYPVNPKAKTILNLICFSAVKEIKGIIDLAIIMVPAAIVKNVLIEWGQKKIKAAIIISSGFKEMDATGAELEKELVMIAANYHMRLLGPNCLGLINPHLNLNASFAEGLPERGNISLISQSGAMAVAILDWAYQTKLGFSKIVSIGNKADLSEIELLEYLAQDKSTEVILLYLESIKDGRRFMEIASEISLRKPIIALKAGNSAASQQAILSHTGSLAGSLQTVETAFKQCGIIKANSIEDLFDYAKGFSLAPPLKNNRVAVITNAGGLGIVTTDALTETTLQLATLSTSTKSKLKEKLPASSSVNNPVDLVGDALTDRYDWALQQVLADKGVDGVMVILTSQTMTQEDQTAELIVKYVKQTKKPIFTCFMGGQDINSGRIILYQNNVPNFEFVTRMVKTVEQMYLYQSQKITVKFANIKYREKQIVHDQQQLPTIECEKLLIKHKLPVLKSELITDLGDLVKIKQWPIVMKIASTDIIHKKASNAVELNINTIEAARMSYQSIIHNVQKINPNADIDGVLYQPMMALGQEIIIGMKRDASFGPVMMFGMGGSLVEIFKDLSFAIAPVSKEQAMKMITRIRSFELIKDYDLSALADIIVRLANFSLSYNQISSIDLNPVMLYQKGAKIVDVRIML
ncbi:MAG: acyl-CoA synthetase [Candidatus Komeilibacteria bacterium CG_4_9_14_0_8_um_filter_36_9]|uniref:Acyl-CoA synthetase n=1 Tax=Candidatus Komeilibacteria bacterium CG_4_9_14_0_8_um_filter_36_9 TaxID=1974473 RepID=A0A2M8DQT1_9BACT|nr:MAG: acyl-CoA synthetase [Candidatus Komeilibacteria bacterium CG_4_9_14_0_8_um_filter_36_9]